MAALDRHPHAAAVAVAPGAAIAEAGRRVELQGVERALADLHHRDDAASRGTGRVELDDRQRQQRGTDLLRARPRLRVQVGVDDRPVRAERGRRRAQAGTHLGGRQHAARIRRGGHHGRRGHQQDQGRQHAHTSRFTLPCGAGPGRRFDAVSGRHQ